MQENWLYCYLSLLASQCLLNPLQLDWSPLHTAEMLLIEVSIVLHVEKCHNQLVLISPDLFKVFHINSLPP